MKIFIPEAPELDIEVSEHGSIQEPFKKRLDKLQKISEKLYIETKDVPNYFGTLDPDLDEINFLIETLQNNLLTPKQNARINFFIKKYEKRG